MNAPLSREDSAMRPAQMCDLQTRRGCIAFLVERRHACRILARAEDDVHAANRQDMREARKLRAAKNPMADRRAAVLEARVAARREAARPVSKKLVEIGQSLFAAAEFIDATIPRDLLLDLLNVNPADRDGVKEDKGFTELVFVYGVENSVERRDKDWNDSPLFRACHRRFAHELAHNEELNRAANEMLFGIGGMFEFLPKYRQLPDGSMKRLPPPLRVVDGFEPEHAAGGEP